MVQLSKIMIGTLFSIIIILGIVMFYTDGISTYSPSGSDNISTINSSMNSRFNELQEITNKSKTDLETLTSNEANIIDRLGAFFASGYDTLKLTGKSFDILNGMIDTGANQLGSGGGFIRTVKTMIPVAILIVIFIAIILNALIKTERI